MNLNFCIFLFLIFSSGSTARSFQTLAQSRAFQQKLSRFQILDSNLQKSALHQHIEGLKFSQDSVLVEKNRKLNKFSGISTIIGGALAHLALGSLYCWGNFYSYSPLTMRFFDGKIHNFQPDTLMMLPTTLFAQSLTMPFGSILAKKYGARKILFLGTMLMSLSVYLSSFMTDLKSFMLLYAFLSGCGMGLAYTSPMIAGWKWLPQSKGLVSGIIMTGYGLGGFLFNLIGTKLANPKGLDSMAGGIFPKEVYDNFPGMVRKLALIYASLCITGSILVSEPISSSSLESGSKFHSPSSNSTSTPSSSSSSPTPSSSSSSSSIHHGLSLKESVKTIQFWQFWFMSLFSASAGMKCGFDL